MGTVEGTPDARSPSWLHCVTPGSSSAQTNIPSGDSMPTLRPGWLGWTLNDRGQHLIGEEVR